VNESVRRWGSALLAADTARVCDVSALGLDEHLMWRRGRFRAKAWATGIVGVGRGQLLDTVPGRIAQALAAAALGDDAGEGPHQRVDPVRPTPRRRAAARRVIHLRVRDQSTRQTRRRRALEGVVVLRLRFRTSVTGRPNTAKSWVCSRGVMGSDAVAPQPAVGQRRGLNVGSTPTTRRAGASSSTSSTRTCGR